MTKAYDALSLATQQMPISTDIKRLLRLIAGDDCIICFKDGSYLVYKHKSSYRLDTLHVETCQDDLPFCPLDLDLVDLTKDD